MAPETPKVVGSILAIPLAHIVVGERLRPVDPVWAAALGKIMAAETQQTPIRVCRLPGGNYLLVAGAHRLEGARLEGWKTIDAVVVDSTAIERRAEEVSENLWRRDLAPLDRAAFVAELHQLLKARAGADPDAKPQQIAVQARWNKQAKAHAADTSDTLSRVYGFTAEAAGKLGFSPRTIQRDLELHRGLAPDVVERARLLPIGSNAAQLRALTRMSPADQRAVLQLLEEGKAKGASEALGMLRQKPKPDADKKAWSAFFGGWSRMNGRRRREALRELRDQGLPEGVKITFDEDANG